MKTIKEKIVWEKIDELGEGIQIIDIGKSLRIVGLAEAGCVRVGGRITKKKMIKLCNDKGGK